MSHLQDALDFARRMQTALTVQEVGEFYVVAVRDVILARGRGLYRWDADARHLIDQAADVPSSLLDEYATVALEDDPVLDAAIHGGKPVASSDRAMADIWFASRAQRVLANSGYAHSLKAPLVVDCVLWGSIHFTRYDDDPPFDARDRRTAALIVDHLGAALTRALRHEEVRWRAGVFGEALDCVPQPVIVSDARGSRVHHNAAAAAPVHGGRPFVDLVYPAVEHSTGLIADGSRRVVTAPVDDPVSPASVRTLGLPAYGATVSVVYPRSAMPTASLPSLGILSKREQEIALLVSQGLPTKEIALRAFISENTVKQHLKRIFSKLNVCSRAEMVQAVWAAARSESVSAETPAPTSIGVG